MERACFTESTKGGLLIARFNQQFRLVSAFRGKRLPLCGLHPRNQKKVSRNTKQNKNVARQSALTFWTILQQMLFCCFVPGSISGFRTETVALFQLKLNDIQNGFTMKMDQIHQ
jgi:hypothetical protein